MGASESSAAERREILMEPFLLVNSMIEQPQTSHSLSRNGRRAAAVMLLLLVALMVVTGSAGSAERQEQRGAAIGQVFAASLVVFLGFWATSSASSSGARWSRSSCALDPFQQAGADGTREHP